MNLIKFLIIYPFLLAASYAHAQDTDETLSDSIPVIDLGEVVVTGTRTPKILAETPVQTRLITNDDIKKSGAAGIQDLLTSELPGVEFSYAMNQQVNMNFAGFAGQNVLILLNGERLAGETMENTDFERLNMDNVERVEIIKGAASALYGSNAAGGVINIITKDHEKKWNVTLSGRVAGHGEYRSGGNIGFSIGKVSNNLDVNCSGIDTYAVCENLFDKCDFRKIYGGKTFNINDRLVWSPLGNLRVTARGGYYFRERLYDPEIPDRYRDFNAGLRGEWDITGNDRLEIGYSFDQYDKSDYLSNQKLDIRDYSNSQNSFRGFYSHTFDKDNILVTGADFMRDYLTTYQFKDGGAKHQNTADIFAQYDWTVNSRWELVGAGRWDWFSDGNQSQLTGKLSARYKVPGIPLTLRGGYAGGFRAPTLKEKYMDFDMSGIFDIHGNPDLKAEKSHNFNLSAEYILAPFNFTAGASYNFIKDKISTSAVYYDMEGNPYIRYLNVHSLRVFSLDASVIAKFSSGITARAGYNYTHEQTVGGSITQYCPARPHSVNIKIDWTRDLLKFYTLNLSLTGRVLSAVSYDSMIMYEPFEKIRIKNPAYTIWKIQAANTLFDGITLTLAVDNIFNYSPKTYYYNSPATLGTNFIATLSIDLDTLVK